MKKQSLRFGNRSQTNLNTVHPILQDIIKKALSYGVMDFSVIEGHRLLERQKELFDQGKSKIDGVTKKGRHNYSPSQAADLLPHPAVLNGVNVWSDKARFTVLAGLMYAAASELGHLEILRWGGDWDGDGNNADSNFNDLPHYEILI